MEIDHVFVFVDDLDRAARRLVGHGLRESYRRQHPGQGTRNACFAFDNLFVELLTLDDVAAARGADTERARLFERSRWREPESRACPFGLAWRGAAPEVLTWAYRPAYLPQDMQIDVATDADDPQQPMLFTFSGFAPPASMPEDKRVPLQRSVGYAEAEVVRLELPRTVTPSAALRSIADGCGVELRASRSGAFALFVEMRHSKSGAVQRLNLPDDVWP